MTRNWHLLDAKQLVLGRLASQAAQILIGKHKPGFVKYQDQGDYVVVINAKKVKTTGKKGAQKIYTTYSGYPSGLKANTLDQIKAKNPQLIIEHAVKGMLPKNKLQRPMFNRLKIFADDQHPYEDKFKGSPLHKRVEPSQ